MIEWLRAGTGDPVVDVAGRDLPIAIRRHPTAKRMTMRLAPDGSEVRITMPRWGRTVEALAFARARSVWLERQLAKVPERARIEHGGSLPYRGCELRIEWRRDAARSPVREGQILTVGGPETSVEGRVRRWMEAEALRLAGEDLAFYCQRAGLPLPQLRLTRAQRRWGSCASQRGGGHIVRINWRLAMAPDHVRRSVVAHEVAHLVHFDHSPAFHALLGTLFEGDLNASDGWLKAHGRSLYAAFG